MAEQYAIINYKVNDKSEIEVKISNDDIWLS